MAGHGYYPRYYRTNAYRCPSTLAVFDVVCPSVAPEGAVWCPVFHKEGRAHPALRIGSNGTRPIAVAVRARALANRGKPWLPLYRMTERVGGLMAVKEQVYKVEGGAR